MKTFAILSELRNIMGIIQAENIVEACRKLDITCVGKEDANARYIKGKPRKYLGWLLVVEEVREFNNATDFINRIEEIENNLKMAIQDIGKYRE